MNAIILAAGMGTRLRPLTNEIPKCLVKVKGTPMVEQQVRFLREAGIDDVTLVSGYKAEKLDYLKKEYGVDIVYNEKYDTCNNIYSLYKTLDRFHDTWVIEGDVYMHDNCFTKDIRQSAYFAKWHEHYDNEWGLVTDAHGRLTDIHIGSGKGLVMSGISYWSAEDAAVIASEINTIVSGDEYTSFFWDNAVVNTYSRLHIKVVRFDAIYEIDTVEDLRQVEGAV